MQIDELWGSLRDQVVDPAVASAKRWLGGVQGEISLGDGDPRVEIRFGERRVMSALALAGAVLVGALIAWLVLRR